MDAMIAANTVPLEQADKAPEIGTPQYATNGNPATGTPATLLSAWHYNSITHELINAIKAGGLVPDKDNWSQLATIVENLTKGNKDNEFNAKKLTTQILNIINSTTSASNGSLSSDEKGNLILKAIAGALKLNVNNKDVLTITPTSDGGALATVACDGVGFQSYVRVERFFELKQSDKGSQALIFSYGGQDGQSGNYKFLQLLSNNGNKLSITGVEDYSGAWDPSKTSVIEMISFDKEANKITTSVPISANGADLAEYHQSDKTRNEYDPGTLMAHGKETSVTLCSNKTDDYFGVVSSNPSLSMNGRNSDDESYIRIALNGLVPVKVKGKVSVGDTITIGENGVAALRTNPTDILVGRVKENKATDDVGLVLCYVQAYM